MNKVELYGLKNSNRNFELESSWGKNQFNNAFPIALACYMYNKNIKPIYINIDENLNIDKKKICVSQLFEMNPMSEDIYYSFEDRYIEYNEYSKKDLPRIDLVIKNKKTEEYIKPIEIKLTTLPDNSTCKLEEDKYGSEIVVRPDTIVYQAFSIANSLKEKREELLKILAPAYDKVSDWNNHKDVIPNLKYIKQSINKIIAKYYDLQNPMLIQPIWKTNGKSAILADNCLDIFVWSDLSFTRLFIKEIDEFTSIDRPNRAMIWLFLMLYDFAVNGKIDHKTIIDTYTYDTKNDKAFSVNGTSTNKIMACEELTKPRIRKEEIRNIILGQGQLFLSPERRLDAVIQSDISLFK